MLFLVASQVPCWPLLGQELSRHEVAVGVSASTDHPNGGTVVASYYTSAGFISPKVRYTFNLNRSVALESSLQDSFNGIAVNIREGGHQLAVLGGVKAGIRRERFGLFGTSEVGAASFTRGQGTSIMGGPFQWTRETHFALQQGVATELYTSRRTIVRLDFAEFLDTQFQKTYFSSPQLIIQSYGKVRYHAATSVTVAHRFGKLSEMPEPGETKPTTGFSLGALFPMEMREHLLDAEVRAEGGGGAWVGFPIWRWFSGDAIAFDHPHADPDTTEQDGGTAFAAYVGPKVGFHVGRLGLYAKARPGIMRFSRTDVMNTNSANGLQLALHPKIDFALDTGLVAEYSPASRVLSHAVLRFEGGSTYIHYHGANLTEVVIARPVTTNVYYSPPYRASSFLFLAGIGYRF